MKKVLAVLAVALVAGVVLAQDVVNGTFAKLEGNEIKAQSVTVKGVAVPTNIVAQAGAAVTATATTTLLATWVKITNVFDNVTNVVYAPTAIPTATNLVTVVNGAGLVTNVLNQR